jgi:hypothetical protein
LSKKLNRPSLLQLRGKKKLVGAEIGVQKGNNARNMLKVLHIKKLYLIDPYKPYEEKRAVTVNETKRWWIEATHKLQQWEQKTVWIRKKSGAASKQIKDNELDFVYIDGSHLPEDVKKDIILYTPKVKIGGLIAGHDYNLKRVRLVVNEMFGDKVITGNCKKEGEQKGKSIDWWIWKDENTINW